MRGEIITIQNKFPKPAIAPRECVGKSTLFKAISETDRRRQIQREYNQEHGITPRGIQKAIKVILETSEELSPASREQVEKNAEEAAYYQSLSPKELARKIKQLEDAMFVHAKNLEFEDAAKIRDKIKHLREVAFSG